LSFVFAATDVACSAHGRHSFHIGFANRRVQQRRVSGSSAGASHRHGHIIQPETSNSGFLSWVFKRSIRLSFASWSQAT